MSQYMFMRLIALLLDHVYRALEERVERSTLKHAILQQGKVDELMDDVVALCVRSDDVVLLGTLLLDGLFGCLHLVLLLLSDFLRLLAVLSLSQYRLLLFFCQ